MLFLLLNAGGGVLDGDFAAGKRYAQYNDEVYWQVETEVSDCFPSVLMVGAVLLLIVASFIPEPASAGVLMTIYNLRSGLICFVLCVIGVVRAMIREGNGNMLKQVIADLDRDTLLLLFGLFMMIEGITAAGVIDAVAGLFHSVAGNNPFMLYTLIVFASVILSAFIDNIPYVATMLPVVQGIAALMNGGAGMNPNVFFFGLLTGATLGGNLTPIGASANIAAIGILRKNGETVTTKDFLRIGVPFTLAAVLSRISGWSGASKRIWKEKQNDGAAEEICLQPRLIYAYAIAGVSVFKTDLICDTIYAVFGSFEMSLPLQKENVYEYSL